MDARDAFNIWRLSRLSPNMVPSEATELHKADMWLNSSAYSLIICIKYGNTHIHTALEKLITLEFGPSHCLQHNSSVLRPWRTPTHTLPPSLSSSVNSITLLQMSCGKRGPSFGILQPRHCQETQRVPTTPAAFLSHTCAEKCLQRNIY